jgi:glutathione S-transferase
VAKYNLYCIGASGNSYKVALYLNCAGLDWAPVGIDFAGGVQRDDGWRGDNNAMGCWRSRESGCRNPARS